MDKESEFKMDSLQWSDIVDELQGNEVKGGDLLVEIAQELDSLSKEKEKLDEKLREIKFRQAQLKGGVNNILKHLKKNPPLTVVRDGFIVVATNNGIEINRNII